MRSKGEDWIRVECNKGDMIVLPEGIYHRFTLDDKDYIKVGCKSYCTAKFLFHCKGVWI